MKKKKKGKKPLDLSALEAGEEAEKTQNDTNDSGISVEPTTKKSEIIDDTLDLDLNKKKKKKKTTFNLDELDSALPDISKKEADKENKDQVESPQVETAIELEADNDFDFSNFAGKKKKKKKTHFEVSETTEDQIDGAAEEEGDENSPGTPSGNANLPGQTGSTWLGSDRDYTYDELLQHVFNIIREKNPDINAGEKKRLVMRPPQVLRVGTKKTSFANFLEICKS